MSGSRRRRRPQQAGQANKDAALTEAARTVMLQIAAAAVDDELASGCPVSFVKKEHCADAGRQSLQLQLESWGQLGELISWFARSVLLADSAARLSFAACLPKECRADVHTIVSKKYSKLCESVSNGFGEERHVAVVAKGKGSTRMLSSEQSDHALALWYLYKQQCKWQSKQQQQQQQQQEPQEQEEGQQQRQRQPQKQHREPQQPQEQQQQQEQQGQEEEQQQQQQQQQREQEHPHEQQQQAESNLQRACSGLCGLQIQRAEATVEQPTDKGVALYPASCTPAHAAAVEQAAASEHEYSRDEVAQMLAHGKLTDELAAMWSSPAGEAQRQSRLLCLAASAGDVEEVQEIIASQPDLVPSSVLDLSSGGQLPLHLAAAAGSVGVLRLLLAAGADVRATNGTGETPLQVAQRCEQCDCEAVLLQAGAVSTQQDSWHDFSSTV